MEVKQYVWNADTGWNSSPHEGTLNPHLAFIFGCRDLLSLDEPVNEILGLWPEARKIFSSTSGEIAGSEVYDHSIVMTVVEFAYTRIKATSQNLKNCINCYDAGTKILQDLSMDGLSHIFMISDGQTVNGSELVRGINEHLRRKIPVTGGLAGDGKEFKKTLVGLDQRPEEGKVLAVGFYGDRLKVGYGTFGGWDAFGPERKITHSERNILYELDDHSALSLYKKYLGEAASELPGSAFFFPLSVKGNRNDTPVVRTILSVDEENQSMTFAGEIPQGGYARLMKHNEDKLIEGAAVAGSQSLKSVKSNTSPDLAILVSCVGRKIVLGENIEEEVEIIRETIGNDTVITGFYSYGEIAPFQNNIHCELHNQTMTVTLFSEE